jgi:hypothetical protein
MTKRAHAIRFPGETSQYRTNRNPLLTCERDLRRRSVRPEVKPSEEPSFTPEIAKDSAAFPTRACRALAPVSDVPS